MTRMRSMVNVHRIGVRRNLNITVQWGWKLITFTDLKRQDSIITQTLLINPLTAGVVHIRLSPFLSAHYISAFKHGKDKKWQ